MPAPAIKTSPSSLPASLEARPTFLSEVQIDFGPQEVLGRLFLKADTELRARGINLWFAPVEAMMDLNTLNRRNWRALVPIFDAGIGGFDADNGFCVLGSEPSGRIVVAAAARLYTLTKCSFKDEIESLRLFYKDPERSKGPTESCTITCPSAARLNGRITYIGGVWFHPDWRGVGLTTAIGRIIKGYAFTRWFTDVTLTLMIEDVLQGGTAARAGYPHVEWEVLMKDTPLGSARAALVWTNTDELLDYFARYLSAADAKVDAVVYERTA